MNARTIGRTRAPTRIAAIAVAVAAAVALTSAVGGAGSASGRDRIVPAARLGPGLPLGAGSGPGRHDPGPGKAAVMTPQRGHGVLVDRGNNYFSWHENGFHEGVAFG